MRCLVLIAALLLGGPARAAPQADGAVFGVADRGGAVLRVAQSSLAAIDAPKRIDTDQETVDFTGRAMAPGEMTLSVNGTPVTLASDGTFRIRRQVPVGRSKLVLVVEGSYGDKAEHKVFVRRTAAQAAVTEFGNFHALVIGNNDYQHLSDLKMAVSDAEAVAAMLIEVYGFNVETLIDATRYDIISALAHKRAQLTEKDNLLIYYAGHGSLDVGSDEGYWLPVDAEPDNPVNWISNNNITGQLRAMRAKHVMVVADSCYSGKLTRNVEAQLKTGGERSAWLERMASRRSRTALTSGGLEPVLDAGGGQYSVFAKAFLETLRANTRVLDGQSLFDAIKRPIVVNADQTPEYADVRKAGHDGSDFIFVPLVINLAVNVEASEPAAAVPALAPVETGRSGDAAATLEQETVFWQTVRDSKDPASFEVYLSEYPNGKFAALARLKLKQLGGETQTAAVVPPPVSAIEIDEMDATFVALKTANLRAEPTTAAERVGRLERDTAVAVTGKLADGNWYRVEQAGRTAFVFGSLVTEVDPAEIAAWQSIAGSSDDSDFEAFLGGFPSGHFAPRARAKRTALAALAPPEAAPAPAPETAPATTDLDIAFWESVKDSTRPADFEAYLRRFPDGHFADLAQTRLGAIREAEHREAVRLEAARLAAEAEARRQEAERQAVAKAEAERQAAAAAEVQTALATPPPKEAVVIDKEKLVTDKALHKAMKDHYKKAGIFKREGGAAGGTSQALIDSFGKIVVTRVAGDIVTLDVGFRWRLDGAQKPGSGSTR